MTNFIHSLQAATTEKKSVLLLDDHPIILEALTLRIEAEPDLFVCGAVKEAGLALAAVEKWQPQVAVFDLSFPDGDGLEALKDVHFRFPDLEIVVFSMHEEHLYGERALRAGASGYVNKQEPLATLVDAIRRVLRGEIAVSPALAARLQRMAIRSDQPDRTGVAALSDRELEIFQLLGQGLTTKEIAFRMNRSVKTVETFRGRMKKKLGVSNHSELIVKAANWTAAPSV